MPSPRPAKPSRSVVVAFTDANRKLQDLAQEKMGPLADMGGLGF